MTSKFEREIKREMEKNLRGQYERRECPNCGAGLDIPGQAVMFGGDVHCSACGTTINIQSDAADQFASGLSDFRKSLDRINKKNRRRR